MKVIIFGAGSKTRLCIEEIMNKYDVVGIIDNDSSMWGGYRIKGIPVSSPAVLEELEFDKIILCNLIASVTMAWIEQLAEYGIGIDKIVFDYCVYIVDAREVFIKNYSKLMNRKQLCGAVAEAGVWKGDSAKIINECFPDSSLYLFDTFEGFQKIHIEKESEDRTEMIGRFADTSEELVMGKMKYPEKVIIKRGLFPETTEGINDQFIFVNLDMDLEYPTRMGLDYFSSRLVEGGIILVHDYFSGYYSGIEKCVDTWLELHRDFSGYPIGDNMSIMITRNKALLKK